ncbi:hypothetical protein [Bifidobacterium callitrichos]|uniref:Uncharacterized protein n=1 Tax=Bifidobacterium callitrichos DSM 23973 TaxID=1437609 RepID=A0A087A162_9BIFI|nr:hypothetical protein [Bifidobacterium callitrichos]KFI52512.1 hypothetical protein BCAL_1845 [Bifidobacterium callitrichos DSM 23973]
MTAIYTHSNATVNILRGAEDLGSSGKLPAARLAAAYDGLMRRFFMACRRWAADRISHPDEENWFAMWMPASASQIG